MSRFFIARMYGKLAAAVTPRERHQLEEWEHQFTDPLQYGEPPTPVLDPQVQEQLQETMPGADPGTMPSPSRLPALLAMAALLGVGGGLYYLGHGQGARGKHK